MTLAGSLATMLFITTVRKKGEDIGALDFFKAGAIVTALTLLAAVLVLDLTFALF